MKQLKKISALAIFIAAALAFCPGQAPAGDFVEEFITMSPDENVERNFYLRDVIDLKNLGPAKRFIIMTTGEAESLDVTLSADPDMDFDGLVKFGFACTAFSPTAGPLFKFTTSETPYEAELEVPINDTFSIASVTAMIIGYEEDVEFPVPITLTFSVHEPGEEEEEDHDDDDEDDGHDDDHEEDDDHEDGDDDHDHE